jgi:Transposase DDE domain
MNIRRRVRFRPTANRNRPHTHELSEQVLEVYRLRWQVELTFKRLKSIAQIGRVTKHDEQSSRAWLYGKLFVALLSQRLAQVGKEPFPLRLPPAANVRQAVRGVNSSSRFTRYLLPSHRIFHSPLLCANGTRSPTPLVKQAEVGGRSFESLLPPVGVSGLRIGL